LDEAQQSMVVASLDSLGRHRSIVKVISPRTLIRRGDEPGTRTRTQECRETEHGERAQVACSVLLSLIVLLGAPLVLKKDNGSAFRSGDLQKLLEEHGITPLNSPIYTPPYNGGCERSGGSLKLRVAHVAASNGRAGRWLPQDLNEALLVANTRSRPFGANGPTPAAAFDARLKITNEERRLFQDAVAAKTKSALETFEAKNGRMTPCSERAAIDRKATQDALCENGYLQFRKGRLSTLVSAWKARRNS
jgi:hypothetical protein